MGIFDPDWQMHHGMRNPSTQMQRSVVWLKRLNSKQSLKQGEKRYETFKIRSCFYSDGLCMWLYSHCVFKHHQQFLISHQSFLRYVFLGQQLVEGILRSTSLQCGIPIWFKVFPHLLFNFYGPSLIISVLYFLCLRFFLSVVFSTGLEKTAH